MANYSWCVEKEDAFHALYALVFNADLKWSADDIRRRIIIPLFLGQLLSFRDEEENLKGFLTYAFMDEFSAAHQGVIGILPADWRSGKDFWVIDLIAPDGDGDKMLRSVVRDFKEAAIGKVKYFRMKHRELRSVTI